MRESRVSSSPHRNAPATGWALAALAAAAAFAADQGSGGMAFFRDRLYYFLPQYDACRRALAAGTVPLWNPYVNGGQPLFATWQVALASPLAVPFLLWPFDLGLRVFWVLALGLAAGSMFALARRAGLAPAGAAVAAVIYAGSGPLRTLGEWPNIVAGLALLPLAPLAADVAATRSPGGRTAVALVTGLLLLSGQPRTIAIAALLTAAWVLVRHGGNRGVWLRLLAGAAAGLAVAAVQLAPTFDLYLQSSRRAQGVPWSTVDESFLHWQDLLTLVWGRALGTEHRFWGPGRLLMPRLYPGLASLWLLWRGWNAGGFPRRVAGWLVPVAMVIALGSPLYASILREFDAAARLRYLGHAVLACWPAVCLLAGAGAATLRGRRAAAVLAVITADLLWSFHGYEVKAAPAHLLEPVRAAAAQMPDGRIFSPVWLQQVYDDASGVPLADRYAARAALLAPNLPQIEGLINVAGYEPFGLATQAELFAGWESRDRKALAAALMASGARWMSGPKEEALPGWILRAEPFPAWGLWEHPHPGPVAALRPLSARSASWPALAAMPRRGRAEMTVASWSRIEVTVEPTESACLSLAIPYCRGWRAISRETRLPVVRSGGVFLGVEVPPGLAAVTLVYAPIAFALGLWISLIAIASLLTRAVMPR